MSSKEKSTSEYNLRVGQFAKLCNTTRDTLRHYYEIGILIPRIDENNGYHYYSSAQISSFYFINAFRMAGCSLKEISILLHDSTKEKIRDTADKKITEMHNEVERLTKQINTINMSLSILENYEKNKKTPMHLEIIDKLCVFKTPIKHKDTALHTSDIASDINHHLERSHSIPNINSFPVGTTISKDDLMSGKYVYNNIISIAHNSPDNINTFALPSNRIICCYHHNQKDDISETYQQILDFAAQKKLTICSDLHIISLINLYDTDEKHTYFKYLFICVE